jgi:hypothetical protein
VRARVGAHLRQADRGVALLLHGAGARDARGDLAASFRRRRQDEIAAVTAPTSMCKSMRSMSGPDSRPWYSAAQRAFAPRLQANPGSLARPQRQGFMAATSMNRAG